MSRGVIFVVWGQQFERMLDRSICSVKAVHPELECEVFRLSPAADPFQGLLEKSRMMEMTPFSETLFLDADTVVLDRLDFGFERASHFGLACCICECPWARRYRGLPKDDAIEYNTGVLFFTKKAAPAFELWQKYAVELDSSIDFVHPSGRIARMPYNDQASFARAVSEWGEAPFILPLNWNFRPLWHKTWFGPIKIWHDYRDVSHAILELNAYYRKPDSVIQYHSLAP